MFCKDICILVIMGHGGNFILHGVSSFGGGAMAFAAMRHKPSRPRLSPRRPPLGNCSCPLAIRPLFALFGRSTGARLRGQNPPRSPPPRALVPRFRPPDGGACLLGALLSGQKVGFTKPPPPLGGGDGSDGGASEGRGFSVAGCRAQVVGWLGSLAGSAAGCY